MKSLMIIVVGPSGVGKSTFVERITEELDLIEDVVTYTTRDMRPGESEGQPYHFLCQQEFEKLIQEDFFVEWAKVHKHFYGSARHKIEEAWERSKVVIMDLDVQGAQAIQKKFPENNATIFIKPPSIDALRNRLFARDAGKTQNLQTRLDNAKKEMALMDKFDHILINDEFEPSYAEFKKMIEDLLKNR